MMNGLIVILSISLLSIVALIITFILFKYLKSWAKGKFPSHSGSIQYGGAIVGFVIIYSLLIGGVGKLSKLENSFKTELEKTNKNVSGLWEMSSNFSEGNQMLSKIGCVEIKQIAGSTTVQVFGKIQRSKFNHQKGDVTFISLAGSIVGNQMYFIYENSDKEVGIGEANLISEKPQVIQMDYTDLIGFNYDDQSNGRIKFTKKDSLIDCSST